ncbi:YciI family protein [Streptacidiphilus pinicola]|uniref:YciI family protein n=1 Tax=Streptacidiphilus pinicola TaxID=2219663 RepID=A0A2X0KCR5_9ACTN|nr:YciI family protein [Streptacidiphilus pinicola]RAG86865.1 YciI family protein [Streptacidiphilus pinicola]
MRYLLMICTDESATAALAPEEGAAVLAEYTAFGEEMARRGVLLGGERIRPTSDARTVRVRDGGVLVADGPFAETKEQFGGYYLVDCKDADEAVEVASRIPGARHGTIEVRPIWEGAAD